MILRTLDEFHLMFFFFYLQYDCESFTCTITSVLCAMARWRWWRSQEYRSDTAGWSETAAPARADELKWSAEWATWVAPPAATNTNVHPPIPIRRPQLNGFLMWERASTNRQTPPWRRGSGNMHVRSVTSLQKWDFVRREVEYWRCTSPLERGSNTGDTSAPLLSFAPGLQCGGTDSVRSRYSRRKCFDLGKKNRKRKTKATTQLNSNQTDLLNSILSNWRPSWAARAADYSALIVHENTAHPSPTDQEASQLSHCDTSATFLFILLYAELIFRRN